MLHKLAISLPMLKDQSKYAKELVLGDSKSVTVGQTDEILILVYIQKHKPSYKLIKSNV